MGRLLSEEKVLKKLGIPDFRHMTKDGIIKFASMLPKMDPEVAKKALEQFPEFAKSTAEIVAYYKEAVTKAFEENTTSLMSFYAMCDNICDTLKKELEDNELTFEEKSIIIDKMIELAKMKAAKDTENKKFILEMVGKITLGVIGAVGVVAAVLGLQTDATASSYDDDDDIVDYQ